MFPRSVHGETAVATKTRTSTAGLAADHAPQGDPREHPGPRYSTRNIRDPRRYEVRVLSLAQLVAGIRQGGFQPNGGDFDQLLGQLAMRIAVDVTILEQINPGVLLKVGGRARWEKTQSKKAGKLISAISKADVTLNDFRRALPKLGFTEEAIRLYALGQMEKTQGGVKERARTAFQKNFPEVSLAPKDPCYFLDLVERYRTAMLNDAKHAVHWARYGSNDSEKEAGKEQLRIAVLLHTVEVVSSKTGIDTETLKHLTK